MIQATVQQVRDAHRSFRRINEEVRLPAKAAWRVARLLNKLRTEVVAFEQTQLKLFRDVGGVEHNGGVTLREPERADKETDVALAQRMTEHHATVSRLSDAIRNLNNETVEIDYDPIPLEFFEDRPVSANDFADAAPFIREDANAKPAQ